jgi:hypothetical protein
LGGTQSVFAVAIQVIRICEIPVSVYFQGSLGFVPLLLFFFLPLKNLPCQGSEKHVFSLTRPIISLSDQLRVRYYSVCDFMLQPLYSRGIRSSGMLSGACFLLVTETLAQPW